MGAQYNLHCDACGYTNPECCAGVEAGMNVVLSTVLCATCKRLYDVPVLRPPSSWDEIPIRCPKSKRHAVVPWQHPGPCPVCDATLNKLGLIADWD